MSDGCAKTEAKMAIGIKATGGMKHTIFGVEAGYSKLETFILDYCT